MDSVDCDESCSKLCYKLRSEKTLSGEIIAVQWSPKMDLIAFALGDGSVVLNRLSWQRVWIAAPTHSPVTAIAWRPDGKVLAVGHSNGTITLRAVENAKVLHKFTVGIEIIYLSWTTCPSNSSSYRDDSALFTCQLQSMDDSKDSDYTVDPNNLINANDVPNILTVGDVKGRVYLYISGLFHVVTIDLHSQSEKILWSMLSTDLHYLSVVSTNGEKLKFYSFIVPLLKPRVSELNFIAVKFGFISCLIKHISVALKSMSEAWEDALLFMDTKLADYAQSLPEGVTLVDEMLLLLACGKARPELKEFLMEELTEKGLQKLGQSVKMSYATIKKIVASQVFNAVSSLLYHMSELLGMSRWYDKFGILGLSPGDVEACLAALNCFALKTHELLLVIDSSMKSGKIFFEWLVLVIRKLSGENLPHNHHQSPDAIELELLMDFLKKRLAPSSDDDGAKKQRFNMEVVGQYFDDQDLQCVMEAPSSIWDEIISRAGLYNTGNSLWLTKPQPSKSLTQLFHRLHTEIDRLFSMTNTMLDSVECVCNKLMTQLDSIYQITLSLISTGWIKGVCMCAKHDFLSMSLTELESLSNSVDLNFSCELATCAEADNVKRLQALIGGFSLDCRSYLYFPTASYIGLVELFLSNKKCSDIKHFHFAASVADVTSGRGVISLQTYDSTSLSVLYSDNKNTSNVGQVPMSSLTQLPDDTPNRITSLADNLVEVENLATFPADMLAVTGSRRLVSVISKSAKKIRLYDVDVDISDNDI